MKCYFHGSGSKDGSPRGVGLISFAIPDIGVLFRSAWRGEVQECWYVSLLSLLKFIELNPEVFSKQELQFFGDCPMLVQQVNGQAHTPRSLEPYRDLIRLYIRRLKFSLRWIPEQENRATSRAVDMPPNPFLKGLNFKDLQSLASRSDLSRRLRTRGES